MTPPEQLADATPSGAMDTGHGGVANGARPTPPITVVVKRRVLGASSRLGLLSGVRDSGWRKRRAPRRSDLPADDDGPPAGGRGSAIGSVSGGHVVLSP